MTGDRWATVERLDVELPAEVGAALRLAQRRARGRRLPVVLAGDDLLVLAVADFQEFYGRLLAEDEHERRQGPGCPDLALGRP